MDDLFGLLLVSVLGMVANAFFWGGVVLFVVKLLRGRAGTAGPLYPSATSGFGPTWRAGVGPYEPGPVESEVGFIASAEGIDLNR